MILLVGGSFQKLLAFTQKLSLSNLKFKGQISSGCHLLLVASKSTILSSNLGPRLFISKNRTTQELMAQVANIKRNL